MLKLKRNLWLSIKEKFWGKKHFPSNILVTAAHGSFKIPLRIYPKLSPLYQTSPRLLLNFSDYGTKYLLECAPEDQKVIPKYGRLVGDPNREKDAEDIIRFKDFGGNSIFSESFERRLTKSWFHKFWLNKVLKMSYYPFYEEVYGRLAEMAKNPENADKPLIIIDVHDTGNLLLGPTKVDDRLREEHLQVPQIVLSNVPDEEVADEVFGTAPDYLMESFRESLMNHCGFPEDEVKINHLFYGGNVTRHFGNPKKNDRLRKILQGKKCYTIQLEFNRGLYMNEQTQRPISWKIKSIRSALSSSIRELEDAIISTSEE